MIPLHLDLKTFTLGTFPYHEPALEAIGAWPTDPTGEAILDTRLRFEPKIGEHWSFSVHHEVATVVGAPPAFGATSTGVAAGAPELAQLSWSAAGGGDLALTGRTDRLLARGELGRVSVELGRQPVSFGTGVFFTPLDLVNPFFPATIDTEYKPGVDAARVDAYAGTAVHEQAVVAWVGGCTPLTTDDADRCDRAGVADLAAASWTTVTVGVSDLGGFIGEIRDDEVFGATLASALGPVGVHADAAVTFPPGHLDARTPTEDVFVRAVAGADAQLDAKTTLSGEAYLQTNGAASPADYLLTATGERWLDGELWALGRGYAAVAVSRQIRPTATGSLACIANLTDPSVLLVPALDVSVADDVDLDAGAYLGLGARPDGLTVRSELGLVPFTGYVRLATWF